jgi:class 3 adenylate cyclase
VTGDRALTDDAVRAVDEYRRRKRAAVLAILFTDLENSTRLRERLGEQEYEALREQHDSLLSRVIRADDAGAVVQSTGDGVLAVFAEPSTAVQRALEIQAGLRGHARLRVRVGIDMGHVSCW